MQSSLNLEDNHDEFQEAKDEVLTYQLSQQIPASPLSKHPKKVINKINERPKLGLLLIQRQNYDSINFKEINKNIKKVEATLGKIIRIAQVTFKSNFQCGNLQNVKMIAANTFEIELQRETNSNRVSSWFYFSAEGIRGEAHFIVKGFTKSSSLFNEGMKICYRDAKDLSKWRRGCTRISYTNSEDENEGQKPRYQLRFSHFFKNNEHTCIQFAYCFPYGLKKLYHLINSIKQQAEVKILTKSFNSENLPLLTIGNPKSDKVIVLSARVHPGETVSSFIMQGFIKQLVGDNQFGKLLRSHFLFKIVPMLNPDGVVKGNYRFSAYGCDLNRKWKTCKENNQPEIYYMRDLIRSLNKQKKVVMYIDMHGHSRKKNVFFYGCCEKTTNPNPKPKQFPYLMEKIFNAFKYQNCCFAVQKDKEGTARITVWKDLKIDYVYTLESTFCGSEFGPNYLEADYQKIGKKLCEGIAVFFYDAVESAKNNTSFRNIEKFAEMKKLACEELLDSPKLLQVGEEDDSGSESQPQVGQISDKQRNPQTGLPKPQALKREAKDDPKPKKIKISTKFLSQQSIRENNSTKLKSQIYVDEQIAKRATSTPAQRDKKVQNLILIENQKPQLDKVEIKIANAVNSFQMETLRASSLYQKNVRVHSITRNNHEYSQRPKRIVNPFTESAPISDREEKLRVNLIHGRQGAQYRRVRKIAEQNMKREMILQQNEKIVKGPNLNHLQIDNSNIGIAPRFYPLSQQRNRRQSLQTYIKKQGKMDEFKRLSINGDQLNVRCVGKHVYL